MSTTQIESLFEQFIALKSLRQGTVEIYRYAARRLSDRLGDREIAGVGPLEAMEFAKSLQSEGLAPATANMYLRAVKTFFRWLVAVEILHKNPFRDVKFFRDTNAGRDLYQPEEVGRILAACAETRWRLMIALAITTGMRRGEILNLTISEIDYIAGVITIRPKDSTVTTWPWQIKDTESRQVPITPLTEPLLLRQHAELPDGQPYICLTAARYQHLIRQHRSGQLTYQTLKCPEVNFLRTFRGICRRAGVPYKSFHALRGSCLSILAEALQPHDLQKAAGHSDFRTTLKHYIRPGDVIEKVRKNTYQWALLDLNQ